LDELIKHRNIKNYVKPNGWVGLDTQIEWPKPA
jgi:hypothetical protein